MHIDNVIISLHRVGLTARGIAREIGVSKTTVLRHFKKLRLRAMTLSEARKTHSGPNKNRTFSEIHRKRIGDVWRGKKQGEKQIKKRSETMKIKAARGEAHYLWSGGKSRETEHRGADYRKWRRLVLERDHGKCVECGSTERIETDHIESWAMRPDLRYDVDNGRALCRACHKATKTYGVNTARRRINGTVVTLLAI